MKQLILTALAVCLLETSVALAHDCDNHTLVGTVAEAFLKTSAGSAVPTTTSIYMESWDGAGNLQYFQENTNGASSTGLYYGTGTYSVSADCIATVIYDGDTVDVWTYYLDPDGKGYTWVNTFGFGNVSGRHADLLTRELLVDPAASTPAPCTLETLRGRYVRSAEWTTTTGVPMAGASLEDYDGAGNVSFLQTNSNGITSSIGQQSTGTYTITDRCIASISKNGAATNPKALYFVAPDGSTFWWMNVNNTEDLIASKGVRTSRRP